MALRCDNYTLALTEKDMWYKTFTEPYNIDAVMTYMNIGCYDCDQTRLSDCQHDTRNILNERQIKGVTIDDTIKTLLNGD